LTPLGLDDGGAGTAMMYAAAEKSGTPFRGRIGIISSMTEPFCGTCSRIRLTADGNFRWCLLDEGEVDLRGPLREGASDAELAAVIETGLSRKRAGHAPARDLVTAQRAAGPLHARSMIRIGG
jgi:cyclic pyranopterin phosphate synthase